MKRDKLVFVKIESYNRSVAYQLDTEKKIALRTYAEEDSADMIMDPYNSIHWLPRAKRVKGGVVYRGRFYKDVRQPHPLGYNPSYTGTMVPAKV